MGEAANRAIMFGVGIFVTLMVVSGIMFIFSQMQEIYKQVGSTDTSISSKFSKYSSYDNTVVTGMDVINCANKYYNKNLVVVVYNGAVVNTKEGIEYLDNEYASGVIRYEDLYNSVVEEVEYDGLMKTRISFIKK